MDIFWFGYAAAVTALSALLCGQLRRWLLRRAILDAPNARSNHVVPVPRGGGIAILAALLPAWGALIWLRPDAASGVSLPLAAGVVALGLISWFDDLRGLPAGPRLLAHLAVCGACASLLPGPVFQGLLPGWADAAVAALIWAGFLNFYNFMDGIDGITGAETVAVAGGLAAIGWLLPEAGLPAAAPLAVAAATVGFLAWNRPPAKLFLGDVGSVPLGFALGWFLLLLACKGYWAAALILPAYYLADAGLTLLRRALRGERFWQAHKEHFYQRATAARQARGLSRARAHGAVSLAVLFANLGLAALAVMALNAPVAALAGAGLVVGGLLWHLSR
jgi:UDP-N-acetylmuramyl pentapeptide phosphotransferase/UDP-N-acetylglucosamine-1-phosphate transferase